MAYLSLVEVSESKLSSVSNINGQLIFCKDTGRFYKDDGISRQLISSELVVCSELPLAPMGNKLYLVLPNSLYAFNGKWLELNASPLILESSQDMFPTVGNENALYIDTSVNCTYRWDNTFQKYFCVGNGNTDEKNVEIIHGGGAS